MRKKLDKSNSRTVTRLIILCSSEIEGMTDCMYRVYSSPKKPQDMFMAKLFAARNIKPLARRSCALVPGKVYKYMLRHSQYLISSSFPLLQSIISSEKH